MHKIILYSSYLSFPFLVLVLFLIFKKKKEQNKSKISLSMLILLLFGSLLFIYSRFIERNLIIKNTTKIKTGFSLKLAVISDIHLGVYKDNYFLKRVVDKINNIENLDAVLIPGDFTYYPENNLKELFKPLKDLKYPIYATFGNHDVGHPGPPIKKELQKVLMSYNVIFLNNTSATIKDKNIKILGLGDNWDLNDDIKKINKFTNGDNLIVITHNPDTFAKYKNSIPDLTISGHTHGGQIRIPFLYKRMIPCKNDFDKGLYKQKNGKLFVTSGLGEVGLPMRLFNPPVIDILELY
jgi:hypothetical protein